MYDQAASLIRSCHHIVLVSHVQPDGDAIGSLLSLYYALDVIVDKVEIAIPDPVPEVFSFICRDSVRFVEAPTDQADLYIVLDVSDFNRTAYPDILKDAAKSEKLQLIDHHPLGDIAKLTKHIIHYNRTSSTAELCFNLINRLGIKLTPTLATSLLLGIYTDTGGFQHSNTSSVTLELASELMKRGANLHAITTQLSRSKSLANLKVLGVALERLRTPLNRILYTYSVITHQDALDAQADSEELHGIINHLNSLPSSQFSLLLCETDEASVRGLLRTGLNSRFNVRRLAQVLGGGGHPQASGFRLPGKLIQVADGSWQIVNPPKT